MTLKSRNTYHVKINSGTLLVTKRSAVGIRCPDHATPSTRKNLVLTSPLSGGRSFGIVRLRSTATEYSFSLF
jgi:hypothetical protein